MKTSPCFGNAQKAATPIARQMYPPISKIQNLLLFTKAQALVCDLNALIRRNTNSRSPLIGLLTVSTFVAYLRCKLMGGMSSSMLGMPKQVNKIIESDFLTSDFNLRIMNNSSIDTSVPIYTWICTLSWKLWPVCWNSKRSKPANAKDQIFNALTSLILFCNWRINNKIKSRKCFKGGKTAFHDKYIARNTTIIHCPLRANQPHNFMCNLSVKDCQKQRTNNWIR